MDGTLTPRPKGYLARLFDQPRWERFQTRRARRWISLAQGVLVVALGWVPMQVGLGADIGRDQRLLAAGLAVALMLPVVLVTGLLNASIGGLTEIPGRDLDEFQLRLRDAGIRRAYLAVGAVTVGFMAVAALQLGGHLPPLAVFCTGWLVYVTWLCAPAHMLAWSFPDGGDDPS